MTLSFLEIMQQPDPSVQQDLDSPITKGHMFIYHSRVDLQKIFNLSIKEGRAAFLNWGENHGIYEHPFLDYGNLINQTNKPTKKPSNKNGVNIVGLARDARGVGEDVRMAALAMERVNIPFSVVDTHFLVNSEKSDSTLTQKINPDAPYHTNLICLPGIETLRLIGNSHTSCLDNRYNIAAWQWELPYWPTNWNPLFSMVDEVWAFSHFIEGAFKSATNKPVVYMPMCVEYPDFPRISRKRFNLPQDKFLYFSMFDAASVISRKNPLGAIHAFLKAFPKNKDVALVIKAMHTQDDSQAWETVVRLASKDDRIHIIDSILSRAEVLGLIDTCDAYISLHRAEGFGRILAEALLLKKPVITTNFSGNTDFCTKETAFLVDGELVKLKHGDYSAWENQFWCDPDIDLAAKQLLSCFENDKLRNQLSSMGQYVIKSTYSSDAVGRRYHMRLKEIGAIT